MPGPITVRVSIPARTEGAHDAVRAATTRAVTDVTLVAERQAKTNSPVATGTLRRSIFSETKALIGEIQGVVTAPAAYARPVEEGTGPQHAPDSNPAYTPPFAPIAFWAKKRALPAGPIWNAIRRRGTKPHPFMRPAAESVLATVAARIAAAVRAALGGAP